MSHAKIFHSSLSVFTSSPSKEGVHCVRLCMQVKCDLLMSLFVCCFFFNFSEDEGVLLRLISLYKCMREGRCDHVF